MDHLHAFRLYRGTSVERAGFSPPAESFGMKFWDTDEDAIYRWDGTQWVLPSPRTDDWVGLNADGAASWQPDNVALLRGGQVTEYADPDDAFTAADTAGDVILVPPGIWVLTELHILTNVSVVGLGGGPSDCVFQSTIADAGSLIRLNTSGAAFNFTVDWNIALSNGTSHIALRCAAGTHAHLCEADMNIASGTSLAYGVWIGGTARQCIGHAHANDGSAYGLSTELGDIAQCEGRAETDGAGNAYGVQALDHAANQPLVDCLGYAVCTGAGSSYGLLFGKATDPDVYINSSYFEGGTADVFGDYSDGYFYSVKYDSEAFANGATIIHLAGDRAGKARAETITGDWTFDKEITQAEQAVDPGAPGAGYGRTYPKDDGAGQTKYFFMDDAGSVYEIAGIVEDLTVTVGAAGDFVTIQAAIDWMKNWIIKGACIISEIDEADYDEQLDFADLLIVAGSTLTLRGDTRVLAGVSYVVGSIANQAALANGGTFNNLNRCTLTVDAVGDTITVSGGTVDPDFDADGWEPGDGVIVMGDDGVFYERIVDTVVNNIINLTVALPGGAFPGGGGALGDGRGLGLKPNRSITLTAVGTCVNIGGLVADVVLDGWFLKTAFAGTGTEYGALVGEGGFLTCENVLAYVEDIGFAVVSNYGKLFATDGACSAFGGSRGASCASTGQFKGYYFTSVGGSDYGIFVAYHSYGNFYKAVVGRATTHGYRCDISATLYCPFACDRSSGLAYRAETFAEMYAASTNANNTAPGVGNYSPAPAAIPGYGNGNGNADIYAS